MNSSYKSDNLNIKSLLDKYVLLSNIDKQNLIFKKLNLIYFLLLGNPADDNY